jgi:hypothetical protein
VDLADWRNVSLWVIAILYAAVSLVVAVVAAAVWWFGRKGFIVVDQVIDQKARPALDAVERHLLTMRDQTARLPGNQALGLGEAPVQKKGRFSLPFRRGKRRFPLLPS